MWVWRVLAHAGVAEEPTRAGRAVSGAFAERVREHSWKDRARKYARVCTRMKVCTRVTRGHVAGFADTVALNLRVLLEPRSPATVVTDAAGQFD